MSNPYFSRSSVFNGSAAPASSAQRTPNGYPTMPGYRPGQAGQSYGQQPGYGYQGGQPYGNSPAYGSVSPQQLSDLEAQYGAPSASNVDRGRMTYDDVIVRTFGIFAVIIAVGVVSWTLAVNRDTAGIGMLAMIGGAIGALILGVVNSVKREPSPTLIMAYAVCEGAMLGAFSGVLEYRYDGIVLQAVLATGATFGVVLAAYKFAGFRLAPKAQRILLAAMGGYLLFSIINFGLRLTGVASNPWGLRGMEVMGIPLGLIIGLVAVVMAAASLIMDFDFIQRGVEQGVPTRYAWSGAFGLVVTLVWLYVEFLRILAILRDN
ncbi:Bax inhibitor-1/YccA family membrane protein [Actinomyces qiguomingii]|uniref:Bax inhibitor-1/YccA family protein n=1 Tax=Actinomyces qiguomingii TaxID=2057800 RepID=UPI000CA06465|nr:Bax inhibitor-1/YccA family protein [Actinomyces qiguomingii]